MLSLTGYLWLGRVLDTNGLVAKDAVLVPMLTYLLSKALGVEDVGFTAIKAAHIVTAPDAFKADGTVVVLTLLEEESAVGQLTELENDPSVLSWVPLDVAKDVQCEEHEGHVDRDHEEEHVQHYPENVNDVRFETALELLLRMCQLVIRVKTVVNEREEDYEGVQDDDGEDERDNVLVVPPILISVAGLTLERCNHV